MENFKEVLLVELLESELSAERRNQLLINLVKNNITEEELRDYQTLRLAIKGSDDVDKLMPTIDTDALHSRIMCKVKTTRTFYDPVDDFKVATLDHLISAQRIKNDRYQS